MKDLIPKSLLRLAESANGLYLVGGMVRNHLLGAEPGSDFDVAGAIALDDILSLAAAAGLSISCVYPRTSTARLTDGRHIFEFTAFRRERYAEGGGHSPISIEPTDSIEEDAKRRDFTCNAVYYHLKSGKIADPLGGAEDIKNGIIAAAREPEEVFKSDGLRLLRLCRFSGELNLTPDPDTLEGAIKYADNIKDISPERITDELKKMLVCDSRYAVSKMYAHYGSFKLAHRIGLLKHILPELILGENMAQREDFHSHDVLEHSFRALKYADKSVRLAALLHDVGKPECMLKSGNYHGHEAEGAKIAAVILKRLKLPNAEIEETVRLIALHMKDLKGLDRENKIKILIVKNRDIIDKLLLLKQADYSACRDELGVCPTVTKWKDIYGRMLSDGTPFSLKELRISANNLMDMGFEGREIGRTLDFLFTECVYNPKLNDREKLMDIAGKRIKFKEKA